MIKAKDIMTKDVITVFLDTEILQAAKLMLDNHLSGLPVVDKKGSFLYLSKTHRGGSEENGGR